MIIKKKIEYKPTTNIEYKHEYRYKCEYRYKLYININKNIDSTSIKMKKEIFIKKKLD